MSPEIWMLLVTILNVQTFDVIPSDRDNPPKIVGQQSVNGGNFITKADCIKAASAYITLHNRVGNSYPHFKYKNITLISCTKLGSF